jgi:hypothetical protein
MKVKITLLSFIYLVLSQLSFAQQEDYVRCETHELDSILQKNNPKRQSRDDFERWLALKSSELSSQRTSNTEEYIIPVVVHIFHKGEALGQGYNISNAQIQSQILVLNEDFNRRNADTVKTPSIFQPVVSKLPIRFVLATYDPQGNELEEKGVVRKKSEKENYTTLTAANELVKPNIWNPEKYLNIFVADLKSSTGNILLGFAYYPEASGLQGIEDDPIVGSDDISRSDVDGVVINAKYFGSNFTSFGNNFDVKAPFQAGRTTTHEVGHWLGLRHPWADDFSCSTDDFCDDTPAVSTHHDKYGAKETCKFPGPNQCYPFVPNDLADMFQNYMDYTADTCMNIFTKCQVSRMKVVLENSPRRKELTKNADLVLSDIEEENQQVQIFPNPFGDKINISITNSYIGKIHITILNTIGQIVWENSNISDGQTKLEVDLSSMSSGIYFIQIENNQGRTIKKVLKM